MSDSDNVQSGGCLQGSCHCGVVRFELELPATGIETRRCDCSLCRRKGALMLTATVGSFRIRQGADSLTLYQWNTQVARHYFCRLCGIYTHHQRRSNPLEIGVNVGCLDDVDLAAFESFRH